MRFNFTKCHHMHIGKHNTGTKYTMQDGNDTFELETVKTEKDLIQVFKILNNIDLVDKEKLFTIAEYRQTRGHPYKLLQRRSRLNIMANSFGNRVVNSLNALPENVVNAPSLNAFKSRLNKHWYGHPNKFEAKWYQVGSTDPNTRVETH